MQQKTTGQPQARYCFSRDGTPIHYVTTGGGPGLVLVHGGIQTSNSLSRLATFLSSDFTVYSMDRRGRRPSGPTGQEYGLRKEVEDLHAVLEETGARYVFGLSSGALVTMKTALEDHAMTKIALYEPPLALEGTHTSPFACVREYETAMAAGNLAGALVAIFKGVDDPSWFNAMPRFVLVPLYRWLLKEHKNSGDDGVDRASLLELIPTFHFDALLGSEMAGTLEQYRCLQPEVLLLGGTRSQRFLRLALDALEQVIPNVQRVELQKAGHVAAADDGVPDRVAVPLKEFFLANPHDTR
jgi:pimeloyl-ACP methyl ester carboxylesterase